MHKISNLYWIWQTECPAKEKQGMICKKMKSRQLSLISLDCQSTSQKVLVNTFICKK